jgi:hypothetical protein
MTDFVWVSTAMTDPRQDRPFTNDIGEGDLQRVAAVQRRLESGSVPPDEDYPSVIWGSKERGARTFGSLGDLIKGYGYWVVSERAAEVIRQFDLGGGGLRPVAVLQKDKITPIADHMWFCLTFGNTKTCLKPEVSRRIEALGGGRWILEPASDGDITVSSNALGGPDMWVDPTLVRAFFLSGALGSALQKAKCAKGFGLQKCPVLA